MVKVIGIFFVVTIAFSAFERVTADDIYGWHYAANSEALKDRYIAPSGYKRLKVSKGSFADFLRNLPMKPAGTKLRYYSGKRVLFAPYAAGIIDLDVGTKDLQQCADTLIRIYSEFQFSKGGGSELSFKFTPGDPLSYTDYLKGKRPVVSGREVGWKRVAERKDNRDSFRAWLDVIYTYAGTASLSRDLVKVAPDNIEIGDLFISPGFPGHTVMVADIAVDADGRKKLLLIEGFTPAMDAHVVQHVPAFGEQVWFTQNEDGSLNTPVWDFKNSEIRRFHF